MSKQHPEFNAKLNEIRQRLMGDLPEQELRTMQLHLDALERWARLAPLLLEEAHDHDHMADHDHA